MVANTKTPWRAGMAQHPGEPVYTLPELAAKLGMPRQRLTALRLEHPGLEPWAMPHSRMPGIFLKSTNPPRFRLSDARRWLATTKEHHCDKPREDNDARGTAK